MKCLPETGGIFLFALLVTAIVVAGGGNSGCGASQQVRVLAQFAQWNDSLGAGSRMFCGFQQNQPNPALNQLKPAPNQAQSLWFRAENPSYCEARMWGIALGTGNKS